MRERILARRRMLVAAAFAAACDKHPEPPPQPCLSQVYIPPDTGPADAGVAPDVVEAAALAPVDAGAPDAAKPKPPSPMPCLTMTAPSPKPPPPKP